MQRTEEVKFLRTAIEVAKILSSENEEGVFIEAARYLYEEMEDMIEQVRIYVVDEKKQNFKEEVIYRSDGMKPGYDFIPFYQLPEGIRQKKVLKNRDTEGVFLLIPLATKEKIVGLIELRIRDSVGEVSTNYVEKMAEVVAIGLSHRIIESISSRSIEFTDMLLEINSRLQGVTDIDELVHIFLEVTVSCFKFDRVTVFLFDQNNEVGSGICITENNKIYEVEKTPPLPDPGDDYVFIENLPGYLFSLNTNTARVGMVLFDNLYSLYEIPERLVDVLRVICNLFATTIDNIRMFEDLQKAAYNDRLTGLYNRRYFQKTITEYRKKEFLPLSLIIGDINGLKITNDVFGHLAGDELLKNIADIIKANTRKKDLVFRWGGDEFFIILPDTDSEETEKICQQIKEDCLKSQNTKLKLSISLGSATRRDIKEDFYDILSVAENIMYRRKLMESREFRSSLLISLRETLSERCSESSEHTGMMVALSELYAAKVKMSEVERDNLKLVAMLHDLGKVAVDNSILNKTGKLSEREWKEVRRHSEIGYRIAQSSLELSAIADYILYHHERWDGKGYPIGKSGHMIPYIARIIAVMDAYTVMVQGTCYKVAIRHEDALTELKRCAGSQFDPEIVEVFLGIDFSSVK